MAGTAGPSLTTARYAASANTLLNGQVAVIGGAGTDSSGNKTDLASIEIFDPTAVTFSTASATLTTERERHQAFLLPNNNNVLITGGTSGGAALASAELFLSAEASTPATQRRPRPKPTDIRPFKLTRPIILRARPSTSRAAVFSRTKPSPSRWSNLRSSTHGP